MKFKYVGDEFTEVFGIQWKPGDTADVKNEYAVNKLRFNPLFETVDPKDKPEKGEQPKTLKPDIGLDATAQKTIEKTNRTIAEQIKRAERENG